MFGCLPDSMLGRMFALENLMLLGGKTVFEFPDRNATAFHAVVKLYTDGTLELPADLPQKLAWQEFEFWQVGPRFKPTIGTPAAHARHVCIAEKAVAAAVDAIVGQIDTYAACVDGDSFVQILFVAYLSPISNVATTCEVLDAVDEIILVDALEELNACDSFETALRRVEERVKPRLTSVFKRINLISKLQVVLGDATIRSTHAETLSACVHATRAYMECSNILAHSKYAQMLLRQRLAAFGLQASFEVLNSPGGQVLPVFSGIGDIQCTWQWVSTEAPVFNWVYDGINHSEHTRRIIVRASPFGSAVEPPRLGPPHMPRRIDVPPPERGE